MFKIITTTQLQKQIGKISKEIKDMPYIITNRGGARMVLIPYFEECEDMIEDFIEDMEMYKNKDKLVEGLKASADSGDSDLVI